MSVQMERNISLASKDLKYLYRCLGSWCPLKNGEHINSEHVLASAKLLEALVLISESAQKANIEL